MTATRTVGNLINLLAPSVLTVLLLLGRKLFALLAQDFAGKNCSQSGVSGTAFNSGLLRANYHGSIFWRRHCASTFP